VCNARSILGHGLIPVCRLGLATRRNTRLSGVDVEYAVERGVNYLNWCGKPEGLSQAVAGLGVRRRDVVGAVQFQARAARAADREFSRILKELRSDFVDIATLYYVESDEEWRELIAPGGVWEVLARFKRDGALRMIGLTSHQRGLAAGRAQQAVDEADGMPREAGEGKKSRSPAKESRAATQRGSARVRLGIPERKLADSPFLLGPLPHQEGSITSENLGVCRDYAYGTCLAGRTSTGQISTPVAVPTAIRGDRNRRSVCLLEN